MTRPDEHRRSSGRRVSRMLYSAAILTAVVAALGCTTAVTGPSRPVESRDEFGFTIRESERVGLGVRIRFDDANRALEAGDYERAIELLLEATEEAPHLAAAHINLGIAQARIDDLAAAEASLRKAIEANPRHPVAHNELGIVLRRMGRFEEARSSYESALALQPKFHHARKNLGILCDLYLSDPKCALKHYEMLLEAVPDDERVAMWATDLRNRQGR